MATSFQKDYENANRRTITIDSIPYYTILEGPHKAPNGVILLIHALMANHHIYDSTVKLLHNLGYQTMRYDHIGHNKTPPPQDATLNKPGAFHFDDFCRHLDILWTTIRDAAKLTQQHPAAIIGCSIGGVLALRYHMLYPPPPDTTTKIVTMAAPGLSTLPGSPAKWNARIQQWTDDGSNENLAVQTLERWFPNPPAGFDRARTLDMIKTTTLDGYRICAWATMNFDYTSELGRITDGRNVMILAGADDANIGPREVLVNVARRVTGSRYVLLEGVGHIPPMHVQELGPVVVEFLSG